MKRTITIQIGNTDDRLKQVEWATYCAAIHEEITSRGAVVHFRGFPPGWSPWQNACWVIELEATPAAHLRVALGEVRAAYRQDSLAWTEGETEVV